MKKLTFAQTAAAILTASAALNFGLRFLPTPAYTFRAWEGMTLGRDSIGAFRANEVYERRRSYGDIAGLANLFSARQYRVEHFTSDRCGNRNSPAFIESGEPADVMLIGTSYVSGSGLNDDETLSAQLAQTTGLRVYNAAGVDVQNLRRVASLAREIHLRPGGTIFLDLIDRSPDMKVCAGCDLPPAVGPEDICSRPGWFTRWRNRLAMAADISPLSFYGQTFRKWLESTGWLPNPARSRAVDKTLLNGRTFLVLRKEISETLQTPHDPGPQANFVAAARKYLAAQGYQLKILIVPNKSEVYASMMADSAFEENRSLGQATYLTALARRLEADGVPTVNLLEPMREAARTELVQGKLLYWVDDTHWNADGVRVAAGAMSSLALGR